MIAVIINGAATALGAVLGVILKKGVPEHVSKAVFSAIGLCLAVMAIQGAIQTENILLMVLSIAIGVAVGTVLAIEDRMQSFGLWLRNRMKAGGDSNFVEAFVTLSVMQVVGAMAILGPIQAALLGDTTLLYLKSTIDGISAFIFGALYGVGAVPVGIVIIVYELAVYAAASLLSPLMTPDVIRELSTVGNVMILAIALNMMGLTKLKVADYTLGMVVPIIYYNLIVLF